LSSSIKLWENYVVALVAVADSALVLVVDASVNGFVEANSRTTKQCQKRFWTTMW
jgi:hypothetical protein